MSKRTKIIVTILVVIALMITIRALQSPREEAQDTQAAEKIDSLIETGDIDTTDLLPPDDSVQ